MPAGKSLLDSKLKRNRSRKGPVIFLAALFTGLCYIGVHIASDLSHVIVANSWPYILLATALLIALGFEFVNGFHDTANAVATVIYTHSMEPHIAVVWSGICNLAGVLLSSGTVAFAIIALLPVEVILKVSSGSGFSMIFALLIAAILWNLGTWWLGLPASSSHTLVGSILGVGLANQLMNMHSGVSGLDWSQVLKVLEALLISPLVGFALAGILILISKRLIRFPELYEAPKNDNPPPFPIRALMVLTCTGVSFFHGSNDGQKGMGLIMLILIGTMPAAYALNHALSPVEVQSFLASSAQAGRLSRSMSARQPPIPMPVPKTTRYIQTRQLHPETLPALSQMVSELSREISGHQTLQSIQAQQQTTVRNDMYLTDTALHDRKIPSARLQCRGDCNAENL